MHIYVSSGDDDLCKLAVDFIYSGGDKEVIKSLGLKIFLKLYGVQSLFSVGVLR